MSADPVSGGEASALREELEGRGFRLEVEGDTLYVRPATLLGEGERGEIRRLRDALVSLLTAGQTAEDLDAAAPQAQADAHLERIAGLRRRLMADDGSPSPCTECGSPSLRNGTRLCATCWQAWQERGSRATAPAIEAA